MAGNTTSQDGASTPDESREKSPPKERPASGRPGRIIDPPDFIPSPLPGVDPEQTPGIDHPPAER